MTKPLTERLRDRAAFDRAAYAAHADKSEIIKNLHESRVALAADCEAAADALDGNGKALAGVLVHFEQVYYELDRARDNLQRRYLNNSDESAGRSARAIMSAMCMLDTVKHIATQAQHSQPEAKRTTSRSN